MYGTDSGQEEVRQASLRLPERQREALELCEFGQLSYGEIAGRLGTSRESVAQLIARARINLYDELRGTTLASVAAPSRECERALGLIAAREDGQLEAAFGDESAWLDEHVDGCERCRLAVEQMGEAAATYRVGASMAPEPSADAAAPDDRRRAAAVRWRWRRVPVSAVALFAVLAGGALAAVLVGGGGSAAPGDPHAGIAGTTAAQRSSGAKAGHSAGNKARKKHRANRRSKTKRSSAAHATVDESASRELATPPAGSASPATDGDGASSGHTFGPSHSPGKTVVQPTEQASPPKHSAKPKTTPTSAQSSQPAPQPPPPTEPPAAESSPPIEEEPADEPGHRGEPPGKPADRPPHK